MNIFPGLAREAGGSASNGASEGQISPILAGPCLVKDNTALGTVPAPGASSHYHRSLADHSSLACSRVGRRHAPCETNAVRQRLAIKRVLTRSLGPGDVQLLRACLHAAGMAFHRSTVQPCVTHILIFISKFKFSTMYSTRA